MADARKVCKATLDGVEPTTECLTGRAGLALFARYIRSTGIVALLGASFAKLRKNGKGLSASELFAQLLCFFADGTNLHLTHFDELADDGGYAGAIETPGERMASSHQVKRWFGAFGLAQMGSFRRVLRELFAWRLRVRRPEVVVLDLDPMLMENEDAACREGVALTYKKTYGFLPLQLTWEGRVVDALFRGGSTHGNRGETVVRMVRRVVTVVRRELGPTVPIVLTMDAQFFDQDNFAVFEDELGVGYVCGGKLYEKIRAFAAGCPSGAWQRVRAGQDAERWEVLALGDRRGKWTRFRRALYSRLVAEEGQYLFDFARRDTVVYTNLGMGFAIDQRLRDAGLGAWLTDEGVLERYHGRGASELVHRALKDFGTERPPLKRFWANAAYYYTMVVAFNALVAFKEDVTVEVLAVSSYATTVRRRVFDIAGKVVRTGRRVILKVATAVWRQLKFPTLWRRANAAPSLGCG